jgi:hypothetical protein
VPFKFALKYAIRKDLVNQKGLELIGTRHLLACADDINTLNENRNTTERNKEALLEASREGGMSHHKNTE